MLIGISDAPVVLLFVSVLSGFGIGIPALPEVLDEIFALFVRLQMQESGTFFGSDDV